MSIQRKQKICKECKTKQFIWSNAYCLNCHKALNKEVYSIKRNKTDAIHQSKGKVSQIKGNKPKIKSVSDKEKRRLKEYRRVRKLFLSKNPVCQFPNCRSREVTLHHAAGRTGSLLTDTRYFRALCWEHHLYVETHVQEALKLNLSVKRLDKFLK